MQSWCDWGLLSWRWSRWKHHVLLWLFACLCYRRIYPRNFVGPAMLRWRNTVSTQTYDDTCIYFHDFPCISRIFCIINQHVFDRICMTFMVASPVIQANSCKPAFFQLAKKWFYKTRFKKEEAKKCRNPQKNWVKCKINAENSKNETKNICDWNAAEMEIPKHWGKKVNAKNMQSTRPRFATVCFCVVFFRGFCMCFCNRFSQFFSTWLSRFSFFWRAFQN